jgi:hypothetical protein
MEIFVILLLFSIAFEGYNLASEKKTIILLLKIPPLIYYKMMKPLGLENDEIADVMNYIMNSWDNTQDKMVTPVEVAAVEK